jgi:hypothetical protein
MQLRLTAAGGMSSIYGTAEETKQVIDLTQRANRSSLRLLLGPGVVGCYGSRFKLEEQ